jgi:hypothetical protein
MTYTEQLRHIKTLATIVRRKDQSAFTLYLGKLAPAQAALVVECLSHEIAGGDQEGIDYDDFFMMLRDATR